MSEKRIIEFGFDLQNKCGGMLPEDEYLLRIVGFKEGVTRVEQKPMYIIECLVEEGDLKGTEHTEFCVIGSKLGAQSFADLFFSLHPKLKGQNAIEKFCPEDDLIDRLVYANIGYTKIKGSTDTMVSVKKEGYSPYMPKKKKGKPADEDEDEAPKKKSRKRSAKDMDDDDADETPKKKRKRSNDDDDDSDKPKKKSKVKVADDDGDDDEYD